MLTEWIIPLAVGALTGVLSGFGIGGGTLLVLYLTMFAGMPQIEAQGINLIYFLCAGFPAAVSHVKNKMVEVRPSVWAQAAGALTAAGMAVLASRVETDLLRRAFGLLLLYVGVRELFTKRRPDEGADTKGSSRV